MRRLHMEWRSRNFFAWEELSSPVTRWILLLRFFENVWSGVQKRNFLVWRRCRDNHTQPTLDWSPTTWQQKCPKEETESNGVMQHFNGSVTRWLRSKVNYYQVLVLHNGKSKQESKERARWLREYIRAIVGGTCSFNWSYLHNTCAMILEEERHCKTSTAQRSKFILKNRSLLSRNKYAATITYTSGVHVHTRTRKAAVSFVGTPRFTIVRSSDDMQIKPASKKASTDVVCVVHLFLWYMRIYLLWL